jgi:hypothetical protein
VVAKTQAAANAQETLPKLKADLPKFERLGQGRMELKNPKSI